MNYPLELLYVRTKQHKRVGQEDFNHRAENGMASKFGNCSQNHWTVPVSVTIIMVFLSMGLNIVEIEFLKEEFSFNCYRSLLSFKSFV